VEKRFKIKIFLLLIFISMSLPLESKAGFGISPPYVKTHKPIFPGAHYEQEIVLLRSSADTDMIGEITINAPEIKNWVSIKNGNIIDLPTGKLQVPMVVMVDVPENAEIGDYKGHINVRMAPKEAHDKGGVAIALAARIEIDLQITNEAFLDFTVRNIDISDFEELGFPWKWKIFSWFLYRINVPLKIENTGNIAIAPTKVSIEVFDITRKKKLESHEDKKFKKIPAFSTETTVASFPTVLGAEQYWGRIKVYKDNDIVYTNDVAFTIYKKGEMENPPSFGYLPWVLLISYLAIILGILAALVKVRIWRHIFLIIYVLSWPLRFIWKKLKFVLRKLKIGFWRWMHRKSSQYQQEEVKSGISRNKKK
jgi:hypothetical protein